MRHMTLEKEKKLFSVVKKQHLEHSRHKVIKKWMWGQVCGCFVLVFESVYSERGRTSSHQSSSCKNHKANAAPSCQLFQAQNLNSILRHVLSDLRRTSAGSTFQQASCSFTRSPVEPALFYTQIKQTHPANFPPPIRSVGRAVACHVKSFAGGGFGLLSALCSVPFFVSVTGRQGGAGSAASLPRNEPPLRRVSWVLAQIVCRSCVHFTFLFFKASPHGADDSLATRWNIAHYINV